MESHSSLLFLEAPNLYDWFSWSPLYLVCIGEYLQRKFQPCSLMQLFSSRQYFLQSLSFVDWY